MRQPRPAKVVLIAVAAAVAATLLWDYPLWLDRPQIERWVLRQIPLGTPLPQARQAIRARGWELRAEWKQREPQVDFGTTVGTRVIHAHLGTYRYIVQADVDVFFGFDDRGCLVAVHVRKMIDI